VREEEKLEYIRYQKELSPDLEKDNLRTTHLLRLRKICSRQRITVVILMFED
jgi:hypothetical protein